MRDPHHRIEAEVDGTMVSVSIKNVQAKLQSRSDLYNFLVEGSKLP